MVVELGDGQVSGLPDNADMTAFYRALQDAAVSMRSKPQIRARINIYRTEEGGPKGPLSTCIRCPMKIEGKDDTYETCNIDLNSGDVEPGQSFEADVMFLRPVIVAPWLKAGTRFSLWSGKLFADGEVIEVIREW